MPIMFMLAHTDTEYKNVTYPIAKVDEWLEVKFSLGLDFPNVPYWIEDDMKITQSSAIMRLIARRHNLYGKDDKEMAIIDMLSAEIMDLHMSHSLLVYNPDFENLKAANYEASEKKLEMFEKFLADKDFLMGSSVTMPDFHFYVIGSILKSFAPDVVAKFPKVTDYLGRFENLPKIKAFMESSAFIQLPWNGPTAAWGGK